MKKAIVNLRFDNDISFNKAGKHVRDGLSSALRTGNNLWVCCDERSTLERLTLLEDGTFGNHTSFDLNQYVSLPAGTDCEVDIEGLGSEGDSYLWIVGSHSLARKKPRKDDSAKKQIQRLAKVSEDPNRYLLARIPLVLDAKTGDYELSKTFAESDRGGKVRSAAQLAITDNGNQLLEALAEDAHFKNFLKIPGKDNGFDIEGLAVENGKIFIGVRGPVLRGWAVILEVQLEEIADGVLGLKVDKEGLLYKKHFLHLEGMGIRDLRVRKNDLLILAGPTMDLDGTIAVYRWHHGVKQDEEAIVHRKELKRLFDVPHGSGDTSGQDKAEGMAFYDDDHLLIVFDTPTDARKLDDCSILADLYSL